MEWQETNQKANLKVSQADCFQKVEQRLSQHFHQSWPVLTPIFFWSWAWHTRLHSHGCWQPAGVMRDKLPSIFLIATFKTHAQLPAELEPHDLPNCRNAKNLAIVTQPDISVSGGLPPIWIRIYGSCLATHWLNLWSAEAETFCIKGSTSLTDFLCSIKAKIWMTFYSYFCLLCPLVLINSVVFLFEVARLCKCTEVFASTHLPCFQSAINVASNGNISLWRKRYI